MSGRHYHRCWCHNCDKSFSSYGIMNHRKAHASRKEMVTITLRDGTWEYDYRDPEPSDS